MEKKKTGLIDYLKDVPDPRIERTREHKLIDILVIGVCCLISGGEGFNDMEGFGKANTNGLINFWNLQKVFPLTIHLTVYSVLLILRHLLNVLSPGQICCVHGLAKK